MADESALEEGYAKLRGLMAGAAIPMRAEQAVELYYCALSVTAMCEALSRGPGHPRASEIRDSVSREFDSQLHPRILAGLAESARELEESLKPDDPPESYEKLRQLMSTKEFAEQYQKGLK